MALSGYADRPRDFEGVLHILDSEVRLITPTDPEGAVNEVRRPRQEDQPGVSASGGPEPPPRPTHKYYQLTHDYLVPSLRDWLNRKLRETRRGAPSCAWRNGAALWSAKPENRFLPAWWEWLALRLLTRKRDWTSPEHAMMQRAARHHAAWGTLLAVGLVLLILIGRESYGRQRAQSLRNRLLQAATEDVPDIVREMGPFRNWLDGPLREAYNQAEARHDARRQLHASLGLLPVDRGQVGYLRDQLLSALPREVVVIRELLQSSAAEVSPWLWEVVEDAKRLPGERLRAACALAIYAADDPRWPGVSRDVAARLAAENGLEIAGWADALRPVRRHLLPPLATLLVAGGQDAAGRRTITRLYGDYARGLPAPLAPLEAEAAAEIGPEADHDDRLAHVRRRVRRRCRGPGRPGELEKRSSFAPSHAGPDGAQLRDRPPGTGWRRGRFACGPGIRRQRCLGPPRGPAGARRVRRKPIAAG